MIRILVVTCTLLISAGASCGAWHLARSHGAEAACTRYSVGSRIADPRQLPEHFFLSRIGPLASDDNPARQKVILCEAMTLCDTSCTLEIENGLVIAARYSRL